MVVFLKITSHAYLIDVNTQKQTQTYIKHPCESMQAVKHCP